MRKSPIILGFEGIDGSSKGTQSKIAIEAFKNKGFRVLEADFPSYSEFFGKEIGNFLSGKFEVTANDVDAKSMSLWYALDRLTFFNNVNFNDYDIIVLNRSTYSNVAYQTTRVPKEEQKAFIDWLLELEYSQLKIPKPDKIFFLNIDEDTSKTNVALKGNRDYVGDKADVYEESKTMMGSAQSVYRYISAIDPIFEQIECLDSDGKMFSIEEIHFEIMDKIKKEFNI